jgi:hypothetical protein
MVGAEILRQCLGVNHVIEHPAQANSIHHAAVNAKADDPSGELIHHDQNPVRS